MSIETPEEKAVREGLPIVRLLQFDIARIATGDSMIVSTVDGGEACVRLFTAEEFLAVQHAACDKYNPDGRITLAKAVEMTRPLGGSR